VGDVAADGGWRHEHGVAWRTGGHEPVEVGEGARPDTDLGEAGAEDPAGQVGSDDLDLLDGLEAHLVLLARVAERRPGSEAGAECRLGPRVHDVGRRVEVEALVLVDGPVAGDQRRQVVIDLVDRAAGLCGQDRRLALSCGFAQPGACRCRHPLILAGVPVGCNPIPAPGSGSQT